MQNGCVGMYESGAATHVGNVRQQNEDTYLIRSDLGLWAVADGMGGHEAGDLASQTVIRALESIESPTSAAHLLSACEDHIAIANNRLIEIRRARNDVVIGTTLAVLLAFDGYYACVWVGDSRIYLVRADEIIQLSRDHTEVQALLADGLLTEEEALGWGGTNAITRAIGVSEDVELEITSGPIQEGDSFVICSDGLTKHVADSEILNCVYNSKTQQACDNLIALALERGGFDNVTVIVMRCRSNADDAAKEDTKPPVERK